MATSISTHDKHEPKCGVCVLCELDMIRPRITLAISCNSFNFILELKIMACRYRPKIQSFRPETLKIPLHSCTHQWRQHLVSFLSLDSALLKKIHKQYNYFFKMAEYFIISETIAYELYCL